MRWKGASRSIHQSPFPTDSADKGGGVGVGEVKAENVARLLTLPVWRLKCWLLTGKKKKNSWGGVGWGGYDLNGWNPGRIQEHLSGFL